MRKMRGKHNRILILAGLLTMGLLFSGCTFGLSEMRAGIVTPQVVTNAIAGEYEFVKVTSLEEGKFVEATNFQSFYADFRQGFARVGLEKVENPDYVAKRVRTFDYFLEKYRVNPDRFKITEETLEVISINSDTGSFYEIFRLDEENIALVKGSNLIQLKRKEKTATDGDTPEFGNDVITGEEFLTDIVEEPRAGVLIGLRGERTGLAKDSSYRTLWITNDGEIQEVYEIKNILFPRKEFWSLSVVSAVQNGLKKEHLVIASLSSLSKGEVPVATAAFPGRYVDLDFVANNYVGISTTDGPYTTHEKLEKSYTISVDGYQTYTPVNITDVAGTAGLKAFRNSLEQKLAKDGGIKVDEVDMEDFYQSLTLNRESGRWLMGALAKTRDEEVYVPVAMRPPVNLITYDGMTITWDRIKDKVPQALDAFNAPGNSFILIRTPKYLMMYRITGVNTISDEPLQMIEIKETEQIIMAEWARGDFVRRWTEVAQAQGQKIIFVQNLR